MHPLTLLRSRRAAAVVAAAVVFQAPPQKFVPAPVRASDLVVRLEPVGTLPTPTNPTSPVVAGSRLIFIDQGGTLHVWNGDRIDPLLGPRDVPSELRLAGVERVVNAAADEAGTTLYVAFISSTLPRDVPRRTSPREPDAWYVLYAFAFDGTRLSSPRAITAMQVRTEGHIGGGLVVLPDGSLLFAVGDNGDSYEDGRAHPQDPSVHLAKLLRINPATGEATVVGIGARCVQRLAVTGRGDDARVSFADPGGWVSEELNSISVRELSADRPANFGWGRGADRKAREGTFYVDSGGNSEERIPEGEPGFVEPVAEFGRDASQPVAVSGPVMSSSSFLRITALFGDLLSGSIYAVTGPLTTRRQPVHRVSLVDPDGRSVTLKDLAGGARPDPRFFNYPDGSAGVLVERTGVFYRITEQKPGP